MKREWYAIRGGNRLEGTVTISGAKNAAVAIIPAAILAGECCILENLPAIEDVDAMYTSLLNRAVIGLKGAPAHHPRFPVYSFFLSDPNGYTLEFQKTTD